LKPISGREAKPEFRRITPAACDRWFALDAAAKPTDMNASGWRLHALTGKFKGFWSVSVSGNWRMIFRFVGTDAELVDYLDYH
jgi:plasmid maintenance system killer protein